MNEIINVIIAKADTVVKRSALILGEPDVPELIAIQALSILGKEKVTLDIPASTCKGMERFYSMFGTWRAGYSEQVKAIRNVQSYVDLACQAQVAALRGEIPELQFTLIYEAVSIEHYSFILSSVMEPLTKMADGHFCRVPYRLYTKVAINQGERWYSRDNYPCGRERRYNHSAPAPFLRLSICTAARTHSAY